MNRESSTTSKKVIHIDMDCFFAAVEVRDYPELKGKPVAIGGGDRGVLSTANYEARKFGVRSAMPVNKALKLCPQLILRPHRFDRYKECSLIVRSIFRRYTDKIEPLSLDEAYLDVSESKFFKGSASLLAEQIKKDIFNETQLTASAGVAPNKFLAKIASDWNKPNGLFVIRPEEVDEFVKQLDVAKIFGVGKKSLEHLRRWNIQTCADLQAWSKEALEKEFGPSSIGLYEYCRGIDHREVKSGEQRKSLSVENTYSRDLDYAESLLQLPELLEELKARLKKSQEKKELPIKTFFIKLKTNDFEVTSSDTASKEVLDLTKIEELFTQTYQRKNKALRLIGLGVRFENIDEELQRQKSLFEVMG